MKSYHDIAGDGGSDVAGQVAAQRARIERRLSGVRHLLAVGSGKGGVGKSTITVQLASALRARGLRVGVLDADLNGPAQARLGGVAGAPLVPGPDGLTPPRTRSGIAVVSLGALFPEPVAVDFDSVAHGESHTWRATREFSALAELLAAVEWGELDFLLVDLPPGAERTQQYAEFLGRSTAFVLVTVPSDLARGVVTRSVSALGKTPNRLLGYVENMSGYHCRDCGEVKPLFPSSRAVDLGVPRLGSVPFDPDLAERCDRGAPGAGPPAGPSAEALGAIVERILETLVERPTPETTR